MFVYQRIQELSVGPVFAQEDPLVLGIRALAAAVLAVGEVAPGCARALVRLDPDESPDFAQDLEQGTLAH